VRNRFLKINQPIRIPVGAVRTIHPAIQLRPRSAYGQTLLHPAVVPVRSAGLQVQRRRGRPLPSVGRIQADCFNQTLFGSGKVAHLVTKQTSTYKVIVCRLCV